MSFQHDAFQHNAFQAGVEGGAAAPLPFVSSLGDQPQVEARSRQGGYSTIPNLLVTTLAVVAAAATPRTPVVQPTPVKPQVQATQQHNLLSSTLGQVVVPIPIGRQQTESAPPAAYRTMVWDSGANLLTLGPPPPVVEIPAGSQQTESAPSARHIAQATQAGTPIWTFPAVVEAIPAGKQATDSAPPPRPRIGSMVFGRGVDPTAPAALPVGKQQTDSAPTAKRIGSLTDASAPIWTIPAPVGADALPIGEQSTESIQAARQRPQIDQPSNLLAGPLGLQPIASAQAEWLQVARQIQVFAWQPPNVTINLPVVAQAIPVGQQRTDSAPIRTAAVQSFTAPVIVPPISGALPIGGQWSLSAPARVVPVWAQVSTIPPDLLPPGVDVPVVVEPPVTGGWPAYYGRREPRRKVEPVTIEQVQRNIAAAQQRLDERKALRRAERKDRLMVEEIRRLMDEQDQMQAGIAALELQLKQAGLADEEIALILALLH